MAHIFHLTRRSDWLASQPGGEYRVSTRGRTLEDDGFIHCSEADQVLRVADALFQNVEDVTLLVIDSDRLSAPVVRENLDGRDERFPHIYGPLNLEAVVSVYPLPRDRDGRFVMPEDLRSP